MPLKTLDRFSGLRRNGQQRNPSLFSSDNVIEIKAGRAPVVDSVWVRANPSHQSFIGQPLQHHHHEQGPIAIGVPQIVHETYRYNSILHPEL